MGGEQSSLSKTKVHRSSSLGRVGGQHTPQRSMAQNMAANRLNHATPGSPEPPMPHSLQPPPPVSMRRSASVDGIKSFDPTIPTSSGSSMMDGYSMMQYGRECHVESIDLLGLPGIEWEGYTEKKGHLVRNWKLRYFTLEGNKLSYYESKENARRRTGLKGRVTVTEVKVDNRVKTAHGNDFVFETKEGKHFHLSAATELDRRVWVHMIEAGIDYEAIQETNQPIYGTHVFQKQSQRDAEFLYSLYRRVLTTEPELIPEFLFNFSKGKKDCCKIIH